MNGKPVTRRTAFALAATSLATLAAAKPAKADATIAKAAVGYQDVPENGHVCAQCVYFEFAPATSSTPASHCKLVAGLINPAGWCEIWAPKGA